MGWSWPRGYFYRCPLPFPRAECSHRDNPGPLHPQLQPGGLRTWHWSRGGRTRCTPSWVPRPSARGQRKPPVLPGEPPAPCTPLAASLDGELGHSPAQAAHRHWGGSSGDKATAFGPRSRDERGPVPEHFCSHPSSFLRSCCSRASAGNGAGAASSTFPAMAAGPGRGWARIPVLTKTGAKMEAGQDERGQALFKLCRHWKKSPVKARKGQTTSFILINLKRVQPGTQHLVTRPAVSAGWFTFTAHSSSSARGPCKCHRPGRSQRGLWLSFGRGQGWKAC